MKKMKSLPLKVHMDYVIKSTYVCIHSFQDIYQDPGTYQVPL